MPPMSEEDIYRKEIEEAVTDTEQQIRTARAHGTTPRLPNHEDLFGKIIKGAARDPRLRPRAVEDIKDYAKKKYKDLAVSAGLKGDITMDPHVLRGLQVHVALTIDDGNVSVQTFSDERLAVNVVDQFLERVSAETTSAAIREFEESEKAAECSEHPLHDTPWFGTRVETCTIN